jgi:hypothetical protein
MDCPLVADWAPLRLGVAQAFGDALAGQKLLEDPHAVG